MKRLAFALVLTLGAAAHAEGIYLTEPQLAQKLFPEAPKTEAHQLDLSDAELATLSQLFGYKVEQRSYRAITVSDDGGPRGTIFLLDVMGQNSPITFGVGVTRDGVLRGVEVVAYREPRGEEIRSPRFLRQLQGKTLANPLKLGVDVDAISGATISSRSATMAARKGLALASVLRVRTSGQAALPQPAPTKPAN